MLIFVLHGQTQGPHHMRLPTVTDLSEFRASVRLLLNYDRAKSANRLVVIAVGDHERIAERIPQAVCMFSGMND